MTDTDATFDASRPFRTRDGRVAVIYRSFPNHYEHLGHIDDQPCVWSWTGRAGGEDEYLNDDLVNIADPSAPEHAGESDAAFVERMADACKWGSMSFCEYANFSDLPRLVALARRTIPADTAGVRREEREQCAKIADRVIEEGQSKADAFLREQEGAFDQAAARAAMRGAFDIARSIAAAIRNQPEPVDSSGGWQTPSAMNKGRHERRLDFARRR